MKLSCPRTGAVWGPPLWSPYVVCVHTYIYVVCELRHGEFTASAAQPTTLVSGWTYRTHIAHSKIAIVKSFSPSFPYFPELPAAARKDGPTKTRPQETSAPNTQRQQQLNDINVKLQQLSATPTISSNGAGVPRPLEPRRNVSRNNSRGSSKNNSRRTSRERASGGHRYNSNQGNSASASPPRSRVTSKDDHTTTAEKQEQSRNTGVVTHNSSCMSNTTGNDDCLLFSIDPLYIFKCNAKKIESHSTLRWA
jgi:hypothetical protein